MNLENLPTEDELDEVIPRLFADYSCKKTDCKKYEFCSGYKKSCEDYNPGKYQKIDSQKRS